MAIINKKIGNTTYVYEATYVNNKGGKQKYKWQCIGKLDENGELIPSRRQLSEEVQPAEVPEQPKEDKESKALAIPDKSDTEIVEAEIVTDASTTRVRKYTCGMTKVEGIAFNPKKNEGIYSQEGGAINVSRNEINRKDINVMFSLDFNELKQQGISIAYEDRLTPFDRAVYNAVATLWDTGHRGKLKKNEYLTSRVIFQLLSGNTGESKDVSPEMRKAILRSIDKMKHTEIVIDASAEAKAFGYQEFKHIGSLLEVERIEAIKINGQEVEDCIHIFRSPILYDYAKLKKQIGSINIKMLDVPKFRNTSENIELKGFLLQLIMSIKNPKSKMSKTVRYETIYEYLRITATTRTSLLIKYKKVRDKVKQLLEFWKSKKLIKDYKEEKEGKIIAKVVIIC